MEAMARIARRAGVQIRLDEPITEILFEGRRAVGVRTDRGHYRSDGLAINADFAKTMTTLVPDRLRRRWSDRKLGRKRYSCSTFMMYLGIEGRLDHLAHHTIFLAEDYRRNIRAIERGDGPGIVVGGPGTGKSLAAEVLATAAATDLLVVDVSQIMSKWVGDTEKNLARIFDAAERYGPQKGATSAQVSLPVQSSTLRQMNEGCSVPQAFSTGDRSCASATAGYANGPFLSAMHSTLLGWGMRTSALMFIAELN